MTPSVVNRTNASLNVRAVFASNDLLSVLDHRPLGKSWRAPRGETILTMDFRSVQIWCMFLPLIDRFDRGARVRLHLEIWDSRPQGSTNKYAATAAADIGITVMRGNPIIVPFLPFFCPSFE